MSIELETQGPSATTPPRADGSPAEALRGLIGGRVHLPGDAGYDAARLPWNVAVDQRPAAVVIAKSVDEVVEAVAYARDNGLRVAPQTTGHNAGAIA
ncbi:FAD-binding protein, partial [Nocardioides sp.]|uniref:FAD-binding protein n=1 Tax=Nocardioides sp. TaxID=35761 RepID=UPI002ED834D2